MKTLNNLPLVHRNKIFNISDERKNGDGIWIYLSNEYYDFGFDPHVPTRQIHEQTIAAAIERLKKAIRVGPIPIQDVRIGDVYTFLPTGETKLFLSEDEIAWEVVNASNYAAYRKL